MKFEISHPERYWDRNDKKCKLSFRPKRRNLKKKKSEISRQARNDKTRAIVIPTEVEESHI